MNRLRATGRHLPFPTLLGSYIDDHDYILVMVRQFATRWNLF
jgi:hypothetical protein